MPKIKKHQALQSAINSFLSLNFDSILTDPKNLQPWNNLDFNDFIESVEDIKNTIEKLNEEGSEISIPINIANNLVNQLNNCNTHLNQFNTNKNQNTFQNAFNQVESLRTNISTWGLKSTIYRDEYFESRSNLLEEQIAKLIETNEQVQKIKENVQNLIKPAVAGSLSKSFSNRKDDLNKNQKIWFKVTVITAIISVLATIYVVHSIVGLFSDDIIKKFIENSINNKTSIVWYTVVLRIGVLFPLFSIFSFSFLQYKKERELEEEYAHKAAVATSLPNYGDLTVDENVKDQILSEASKVIFTSPIKSKTKKDVTDNDIIEKLNQLLGNIQKIIPKSG